MTESSSTSRSPSQITGARISRSSFLRPLLSLVGSWQNISFHTHCLGMWCAASQGCCCLQPHLSGAQHQLSSRVSCCEVAHLVHVTLAGFREASPSKIQPSCSTSAELPASGRTGPAASRPYVGICAEMAEPRQWGAPLPALLGDGC